MRERCVFQMTQQSLGPGKVKENTFIRDNQTPDTVNFFPHCSTNCFLGFFFFLPAEQPVTKQNISHVSAQTRHLTAHLMQSAELCQCHVREMQD